MRVTQTPAVVECAAGEASVKILECRKSGEGYALVESKHWRVVGEVERGMITEDRHPVTVWRGFQVANGQRIPRRLAIGRSKREAIEMLLEELGYYEIEDTETIPSLFELEPPA